MNRKELKTLTNKELDKLLSDSDWRDKDLIQEYNERKHDGRIKFSGPMSPEEFLRKRNEQIKKKKAS